MAEETKGVRRKPRSTRTAPRRKTPASSSRTSRWPLFLSGEKNARGIPYVAFIDSVEGTLATTTDGTVEKLIGAMNELHQKFKILEGHKARTKASMKLKIPEIKRTLQLVRHIQEKHEAQEDPLVLIILCRHALWSRKGHARRHGVSVARCKCYGRIPLR